MHTPPSRLKLCADVIDNNYKDYSLLDIGCRTMALKPLLRSCKHYYGTDLTPGKDIFVCNLEDGLGFAEDKSFDIVCALDVLEHLEHAHHALSEALRVSRRAVIVTLPNMYHWTYRLRYLRGKVLSNKYSFPSSPIIDRHRWITDYNQSLDFIISNTQGYAVSILVLTPDRGRTRVISKPIETFLSKHWPNVFASRIFFHIQFPDF